MMLLMTGMAEFGALIKRAREQRGLTGVELAHRIGRQHSFVVRYEKGQPSNLPDPHDFNAFARELGLSKTAMLEAAGYLDPEPASDVLTIPADDPRADLLRMLDGETDVSPHGMRHVAATLLLEAGVDVKVVADTLGHSTTTTTRDIYQHVTERLQRTAAETLGALLEDRASGE